MHLVSVHLDNDRTFSGLKDLKQAFKKKANACQFRIYELMPMEAWVGNVQRDLLVRAYRRAFVICL
jgi:hypothetical protein